ncbi:unnamed protein product [marine sediment metagenome]|uniref:Uncharacterized protein n=1 Tax=marine sediment metagenome TaxID=412755 RepID=X1KLU5_9ZZZZ
MARPNNKNGGRPKKPIDWKEAEKLCALQCSELEIADWFHISVDTLARRLKEEKNASFAEFFTLHRVQGKIALRRNMFNMSVKSPQMAIFLAKNWLGMADKTEIANPIGESFRVEHDAKSKLIGMFNRLAARAGETEGIEQSKPEGS